MTKNERNRFKAVLTARIAELERLIRFCLEKDIRPTIHATLPLAEARQGFQTLLDGDLVGKIVFQP